MQKPTKIHFRKYPLSKPKNTSRFFIGIADIGGVLQEFI